MESAQNNKNHVLITDVGSYLGAEIAKSLLQEGYVVHGQGASHLSQRLLSEKNFTLLEIDLAQPLPAYLPAFDIIFDLTPLRDTHGTFGQMSHISPQLSNIISLVKAQNSQVFIFAHLSAGEDFYDQVTGADDHLRNRISLFLTGDIYGPDMPLTNSNKLSGLIAQAIKSDKVVLENEGLDHVYPAFVSDVIFAITKIAFSNHPKKIHYLTSEGAATTLSVAYEIQSAARFCSNKELGLFFSAPQDHIYPDAQIVIHHTEDTPKTDLKEGLKRTFDFFTQNGHVQDSHQSTHPGGQTENQTHQKSHIPPAFVNTEAPRSKSRFPSLPKLNFDLRPRKVVLVLLVVLLLTVAKTGIDIYLGQKDIKAAQKSILAGDFQKGHSQALNSQKSFKAAANKIKILTSPITLVSPNSTKDINGLLQSAQLTAGAAAYFIEGAQVLASDFSQISNPDAKQQDFNLETPSANFNRAYINSSQAQYLLADNSFAQGKLKNIKDQVETLKSLSQRAYEITNMTSQVTGEGSKKTYLVLFVNNTELRPGGGFIGNFATVDFDQGKLQSIQVEDVYTIDGQLKEKIEPPAPLKEKLGVDNFYLRDSNWSGDFELNSKTVRDFFKKETGKDVDGVIAIDLTLVQQVLKKMGPITLSDYNNEQITAENLFERGEYYSEVGFFPGSTQKKDFFGALTRAMVAKIITSIQKPEQNHADALPWLALVDAASEALPQKHLMLTFDDPILSSFVKTKGWDHPLPPATYNPADDTTQTSDFVAIVEANVGANKVNRQLERKVSYEMTVGKDADLVGKLTITYTNNSQAETWPAGKYTNYLRVYAPFASSLFDYKNGDSVDLAQVETTIQGPLTVFATYVEVPIKSSKTVSFTYRIPKNIKLETAPTYSVYFQKQAGTEKDPLDFTFNLPAYLQVSTVNGEKEFSGQQNITINSDLSTDRQFQLDLGKK